MEKDFHLLVSQLNDLQIFHSYADRYAHGDWDSESDTYSATHITDQYFHRCLFKALFGKDPEIHDGNISITYENSGHQRSPDTGLFVNEDFTEKKLCLFSKILHYYNFEEHADSYKNQKGSLTQKIIGSFYTRYQIVTKKLCSGIYKADYTSARYDTITNLYQLLDFRTKEIIDEIELTIINHNPIKTFHIDEFIATRFMKKSGYKNFMDLQFQHLLPGGAFSNDNSSE